jgi:protein-disulfide isomerase
MILDNNLVMSDAQALTAAAASTKSIDFTTALRHAGDGEPVELVVQVASALLASGGAANLTVALQDSADNSSFADVVKTAAIAKASLVAGFELLRITLPKGLRRYIQVYYTPDTNDFTSGTVNAYLVLNRQNNVARPSGFSV